MRYNYSCNQFKFIHLEEKKMKKLISILLAAVMLLSVALTVASCSGKEIYLGVQSGTTGQYYVDGDEDWYDIQPKWLLPPQLPL